MLSGACFLIVSVCHLCVVLSLQILHYRSRRASDDQGECCPPSTAPLLLSQPVQVDQGGAHQMSSYKISTPVLLMFSMPTAVSTHQTAWTLCYHGSSRLCSHFVNGLQDDIKTYATSHCVGWENARLIDIRRYADHAERNQQDVARKKKEKREDSKHQAALTMLSVVQAVHQTRGRGHPGDQEQRQDQGGRGGGYGGSGRPRLERNQCAYCLKCGHWAKDCPNKGRGRSAPARGPAPAQAD